jgi:transcriptional regulator with XRE-family HTH domain
MNDNPAHPLVQMLTAYRRSIGVTQEQVAKTMGTGQSAVSEMERGTTQPQLLTVIKYADALGLRIVWGIAGIDADRLWLNRA